MTLYYALVFSLLVLEMAMFCVLVLPLPFKMRRSLFVFINTSPLVAKLQYGLKITFIFILVLFIDSVNRVFKVSDDAQARASVDVSMREQYRSDVQARKFYSQRNMYLTGFTLFLSLILNRVFVLANTNLRLQDLVDNSATKNDAAIKSKAYLEEIDELKTKLKKRDADFDELAEKYKQATATGEAKKSA
ncbi:hypothetical protein BCR37DRAFT_375976 [Protomyces lactucae-debilis]|uniref:Endoplasmic reticulum transmembrane protein n=1 Tax=Protomyces lactucae-debilis TaxID=2754530 RepID=A0A1Y2FXH4_PROLT|nr:uncharacterized protein BCR37DRAFT_375976 [Protomyces lactucae-debilis]ORY87994.1 hypothetical protein BCR37DRAFT_375976 [Protomyces lactucae-debilis]